MSKNFLPSGCLSVAILINRPNFCPSTTWSQEAITFANRSFAGVNPFGIFASRDNTLYVVNREKDVVHIWFEGSVVPDRNISGGLNIPHSVLVATNGDIYVDNGATYRRVDRWAVNTTNSDPFMAVPERCFALFIDMRNDFYCASTWAHQVVKKWIGDNSTVSTIVAGTGTAGSAANMLYYPSGLFVDLNFTLYVGDSANNRVQMFLLGQSDGVTIVGDGAPGTFTLDWPTAIIFDANGYLFISDKFSNRLIGSGPMGFRCLFGCSTVAGSAANQLNAPRGFTFDTYGNIFVADENNDRIQKFLLASNSCSECFSVSANSIKHVSILGLSYNQPRLCADAA